MCRTKYLAPLLALSARNLLSSCTTSRRAIAHLRLPLLQLTRSRITNAYRLKPPPGPLRSPLASPASLCGRMRGALGKLARLPHTMSLSVSAQRLVQPVALGRLRSVAVFAAKASRAAAKAPTSRLRACG